MTKCKVCGMETPITGRDMCGVCSEQRKIVKTPMRFREVYYFHGEKLVEPSCLGLGCSCWREYRQKKENAEKILEEIINETGDKKL